MSLSKYKITPIVSVVVWLAWLTILGFSSAFSYLIDNWEVAVTMIFGSAIAGGTSLGGGAVAFPVFTKLLHIAPADARIFSLAIQSIGMSAASLTIWLSGITVEWRIVRWGSLGGFLGIFLGLRFFAPIFPPDAIKMSFTLLLASFAMTLWVLSQKIKQRNSTIAYWGVREKQLFFLAGIMGGIISGLVGNGIDILVFSVMVLLFRLNEKIATSTSVVLMAINAIAGFALQVFFFHDFGEPVLSYWFAAIPVVVIGAPVGAILCNLLSRQTIANFLISLISIELVTSFVLIPPRAIVVCSSVVTLIVFSGLNYWMYRQGMTEVPEFDSL
ncbi:sulfite exporter TauE/SafE family protein [Oscillatoriales cyanobacterium LEGE 11467]|uniref:Probable membrane transporter protein n=1 Tax=Zarconia navalis LEGE 11467 TaxID=1828826 RepID=A0A928VSB6_9CYAN|nr:sulfite exporter TauE/SafE family protein [Zarconia navalis]MBE9039484.1 sulfite exporter TauE/SafE family protein [Zarconia navalis LEGE 11467]